MKTKLIFILAVLIATISLAQNGINYKAVIKDGSGVIVANDLIQVQFSILKGVAQTNVYSETHSPTTDSNGVIIVNIGEGALVAGSAAFSTIDWSSDSHFLEVFINIGGGLTSMGITEFKTVPYALSSADGVFTKNGNDAYKTMGNIGIGITNPTSRFHINDPIDANILLQTPTFSNVSSLRMENGDTAGFYTFFKLENRADVLRISVDSDINGGAGYEDVVTISPSGNIITQGSMKLGLGTAVIEFSTDGSLSGNSNFVLPTEQAVKTYVDNVVSDPVIFKVRGNGFAVKDIDGGTEVETDIWDIVDFDTANAFNTTTDRFVAPTSGYYFLHACVRQANFVTTAFFRIRFNVDFSARYNTITDGDDVKTEVSGIYYLNAGQEVYVFLRNYTVGDNERMDGAGSWFEGYKID